MKAAILSGRSIPEVANQASEVSCLPLVNRSIRSFANGEIICEIKENIRGKHIFIIQSTSAPVNNNLMELLIMIDTVKRSFAEKITVIIPHFGYARQDRQASMRTPITGKLVAKMIENAGAHDVVAVDIHSTQTAGFFDIPFLNISGDIIFRQVLQDLTEDYFSTECCVVSPDAGGMKRARKLAEYLNLPVAMIDKRRTGDNKAEAMHVVGDVNAHNCIIYDDMVDTAGTLVQAAYALKENGAKNIYACMTHGVLSEPATTRIAQAEVIQKLIISDSIKPEVILAEPNGTEKILEKRTIVPIGPLLGKMILMKVNNESISHLLR